MHPATSSANGSVTTQGGDSHPGKFSTILIALIASAAAAELVEVNRFLRTVREGRSSWFYLGAFLVILGILLGTARGRKESSAELQKESLVKGLLLGIVFGFVASLIVLSATPLLTDGRLSPTINAWKEPARMAFVAFLCFGWFYGAVAELTIFFIRRSQYQRVGVLVLTSVAIRLIETLPLARLFHR